MKSLTSKVLVLGAQGVGKTTLATRLVDNLVNESVSPTLGVSYAATHLEIGDHIVQLQFWDTAGQERFRSMIPMYYRRCTAALLVYDICSIESFRAVKMWESELRRYGNNKLVVFVIGNKCDMHQKERNVDQKIGNTFAESIGGHFREVSAISNQGIDDLKMDLCVKLIHQSQIRKRSMSASKFDHLDSILLEGKEREKPASCCS